MSIIKRTFGGLFVLNVTVSTRDTYYSHFKVQYMVWISDFGTNNKNQFPNIVQTFIYCRMSINFIRSSSITSTYLLISIFTDKIFFLKFIYPTKPKRYSLNQSLVRVHQSSIVNQLEILVGSCKTLLFSSFYLYPFNILRSSSTTAFFHNYIYDFLSLTFLSA